MKKIRLLVADDTDEMRNYMVALLCREYHVVGTAVNGEELVHAATCLLPDVIVSDISMPRMDGLDARDKLIAQGKLIPFVFVSLHGKEIIRLFPKTGAVGLVYKIEIARHLFKAIDAVQKEGVYRSPFYSE